jgi:hypothetical protein
MRTIFLGECLGLVLAFATGCGRAPESTVVFTNQIGRTVPELTMQAGQWHFGPVEVKKDSSVTAVFRESPGRGGAYELVLRWPSERWAQTLGNIRSGMVYRDEIELGPQGPTLRSKQYPPGGEKNPLQSEQGKRWTRVPSGSLVSMDDNKTGGLK